MDTLGEPLTEEHSVRGLPWLEDALLLAEGAPAGAEAAEVGARELAVLAAHGEAELGLLRLAELQAIFPDQDELWQTAQAELESAGQPWPDPDITWYSEPGETPEGGVELVLLWGTGFPRSSGRDPQAVVRAYDLFDGSGLRVHTLVKDGPKASDLALRMMGALNRPVGIGAAPPSLWDDFDGGRTSIALLVRGDQVVWRGYPSQLPVGSLESWLESAHRASHRQSETALSTLIEGDLSCDAWVREDVLRRAGLAGEGEAVGTVSSVEARGCGKERLYVALDEETWLSEEILFGKLDE